MRAAALCKQALPAQHQHDGPSAALRPSPMSAKEQLFVHRHPNWRCPAGSLHLNSPAGQAAPLPAAGLCPPHAVEEGSSPYTIASPHLEVTQLL